MQLLGLQRVGFNTALLNMLAPDTQPATARSRKRTADEMGQDEYEDFLGRELGRARLVPASAGPSRAAKAARLDPVTGAPARGCLAKPGGGRRRAGKVQFVID